MTAIAKDCIESINLSSDELMLKELERRDGIYSFIFYELEGTKDEALTRCISPAKIMHSNYTATTTTPATYATTEEIDANVHTNSCLLPDGLKFKAASVDTSSNTTTTTEALTSTTAYNTTFATSKSPATAAVAASLVPSLFAASPLTARSGTNGAAAAMSALSATLPCMPTMSGGVSMRSYHEYLKTWHPPPSLAYSNPKLFAYMANCDFRVRVPTPRFSHISAPLVRNRRHCLKETPEYRRMSAMCTNVVDLRALFPHDPDVQAPFAATVATAPTTALIDGGNAAVALNDGCGGEGAASIAGSPAL